LRNVHQDNIRHFALLSRNPRGVCGHFTILSRYLLE
jgi:hypothetical protein